MTDINQSATKIATNELLEKFAKFLPKKSSGPLLPTLDELGEKARIASAKINWLYWTPALVFLIGWMVSMILALFWPKSDRSDFASDL